jgi:hypothetical protein
MSPFVWPGLGFSDWPPLMVAGFRLIEEAIPERAQKAK